MTVRDPFEDLGALYDRFYDEKRKSREVPEAGQIIFCPVTELDRRPRIADVRRVDSTSHDQITIHIREQEKGDYRGKEGRLPIKGLNLESTHELLVSRAKLRPCLVLGTCSGIDPDTLPDGPQRKLARKAFYPVQLVAPVFSVSTADELGAFGPIVSARTRCLMYPEFFYLRQSGGYLKSSSIARLDRVFVGSPHPGSGYELTDLFVIQEILGVVLEQLRYILGQPLSRDYVELREMMLAFLPKEGEAR
jgi:hypothetical protein